MHVPYSPVPTLPETIASITTLAADIRNRASGKPKEELLDLSCIAGHCGVVMSGGAALAENQEGFAACPCPCPDDPAKALDDAATALAGPGMKAIPWATIIAIIKMLLDQFFPPKP